MHTKTERLSFQSYFMEKIVMGIGRMKKINSSNNPPVWRFRTRITPNTAISIAPKVNSCVLEFIIFISDHLFCSHHSMFSAGCTSCNRVSFSGLDKLCYSGYNAIEKEM